MAWRYHGFTSSDPYRARARGTCDRCGFVYDLCDLPFQYDYRGNNLTNTRFRVCSRTCLDKPYEGLRPVKIPPDPVPVRDARPENFLVDENEGTPWFPVPPTFPNGTYTTEDGVKAYTTEDGKSFYRTE